MTSAQIEAVEKYVAAWEKSLAAGMAHEQAEKALREAKCAQERAAVHLEAAKEALRKVDVDKLTPEHIGRYFNYDPAFMALELCSKPDLITDPFDTSAVSRMFWPQRGIELKPRNTRGTP